MPLEDYHKKRSFARTPEPEGAASDDVSGSAANDARQRRLFVVQKHAASRLHYDFRLEIGGVLASWAVPKGPSLDTRDRRLAVHVEDHPLEYGSFEGTIPKGEYGGGAVMVWDRGTYEPVGDFDEDYSAGKAVKFVLHGEKLNGGFTLVHMKPREKEHGDNWLLIKERDEHVRPHDEYDVLEARPDSVASGRELDQIAADDEGDAEEDEEEPQGAASAAGRARQLTEPARDIPIQLARLVETAPEGNEWIHEVKYDGYRVRAWLADGVAHLYTRTGQDWSDRFEPVAEAVATLPASSALLDGEVVVLGANGVPDFSALQHALSSGDSGALDYIVFDLLALDDWDLRDVPLLQRKELLRSLLEAAEERGPLVFAEHVQGAGEAFHDATCELELEGSVSKRADAPYRAGRTAEWRKVKCLQRQEFVIGGYTEPGGSRRGFGALLLGVYEGKDLVYVGRVGTGFTGRVLDDVTRRLEPLRLDESPFIDPPDVPGKTLHWTRPELVAEVRFQEWTPDGMLRHPSFVGLREDKPAEDVARESIAGGGGPADISTSAAPPQTRSHKAKADAVVVAGVRITNPNKVLFPSASQPEQGVTKLALARYYEHIAERLLVHDRARPLTLVRCPHGRSADCFYQKHPEPKRFPDAIHTVEINEHDGTGTYMYVDDVAGVVSLVQLGVLEVHAWNSTVADVEHPDRIVFDLDPGPGVEWRQVADAALLTRDALDALGLRSFLKATGGKGLHVVVPIVAEHDYDAVRSVARAFVDRIAEHDPNSFTVKMAKSARPGKVFLDYLRNAHGATAVTLYSTRARAGAPVALPLAWSELDAEAAPLLSIEDVPERLESQTEDPWIGYENDRNRLSPALFAVLGVPVQEQPEQ